MIKKTLLLIIIGLIFIFTVSCSSDEAKNTASETTSLSFVSESGVNTNPSVFETTVPVTTEYIPEPEKGSEISVKFQSGNKTMGSVSGSASQKIQYGKTWTQTVKAVPKLGYKFVSWSDGCTDAERGKETFKRDTELIAYFDYDFLEMPVVEINTNGLRIKSKTDYIKSNFTLMNSDGYDFENAEIEIRGRGNYTWTATEKKSYRVKFAEKINLLGQGNGPARSWTLLAVHCDKSMLRTDSAFFFARQLSGLDYTSSSGFVELFINGEYQGVYNLCEQMQVQKYRVNIDDSGDSEDIGYLLELDKSASENVITTSQGIKFELKSDYTSKNQLSYISSYLSQCYSAILSKNKAEVEKLIDIDSVVDAYIVEELFKNLDAGWGSFYMYKPAGEKLRFGPVWDFDISAGNAESDDSNEAFKSAYYTYAGNSAFSYRQQNEWFVSLCKCDWFVSLLKERWKKVKSIADTIPAHIDEMAEKYSGSFERNFEKWQIFSQKINREPWEVLSISSFEGQTDYLKEWLSERIEWLTDFYNGDAEDYTGVKINSFKGSGGKGTKESPYLVSSAKDFLEFTNLMKDGNNFENKYFEQTADIDMTNLRGYNGIGGNGNFSGIYDGKGHSITVSISGTDESVFPYVFGVIVNLYTKGSVQNTVQASGICRSLRVGGKIINCISSVKLSSSTQNAGGITSSNASGGESYIIACAFIGTIEAPSRIGAINAAYNGPETGIYSNYYSVGLSDSSDNNKSALNDKIAELLNSASSKAKALTPVDLLSFVSQDGKPEFKK